MKRLAPAAPMVTESSTCTIAGLHRSCSGHTQTPPVPRGNGLPVYGNLTTVGKPHNLNHLRLTSFAEQTPSCLHNMQHTMTRES